MLSLYFNAIKESTATTTPGKINFIGFCFFSGSFELLYNTKHVTTKSTTGPIRERFIYYIIPFFILYQNKTNKKKNKKGGIKKRIIF